MPSLICWNRLPKYIKFTCSNNNISFRTIYFIKDLSTDSNGTKNTKKNNVSRGQIGSKEKNTPLEPPEEPTTCCMSGCSNCVWLDYAEALCNYYKDGGEKALKEINERISDPNIKAYILHEIRMRNKT